VEGISRASIKYIAQNVAADETLTPAEISDFIDQDIDELASG
jgi:hypothetical protein